MRTVNRVVIPAAGWGTRFLPATKVVPKEMLPLVGQPIIHYGVEEASASGIGQVIIVTSQGKEAMEDYFLPDPELEAFLKARGKTSLLATIRDLSSNIQVTYIIQEEQLGLGHAILIAEKAVGPEPFAVLLPDDVIQSQRPVLAQMIDLFQEHGASILAVERVSRERVSDYGIIDAEEISPGFYRVRGLVEKPRPLDAPSDLGIVGRYILTPRIFDALRRTEPGALGEIQVTDGIARLLESEPVYAYQFQGIRHDAGTPLGLIKASISIALSRDDLAPELRAYLSNLPEVRGPR